MAIETTRQPARPRRHGRRLTTAPFLHRDRAIEAEFGADPVPLTVSIGTASFPADGTTVERVLRVADERLYQAKSGDVAGGESPADRSLLFGYSAGPKLTVASRAL